MDDFARDHLGSHTLLQILDFLPQAVAILDEDMRVIAANEPWLATHRLDAKDTLGKGYFDIFPDTAQDWQSILGQALAGETRTTDDVAWTVRPWYKPDANIGGVAMLQTDPAKRATPPPTASDPLEHIMGDNRLFIQGVTDAIPGIVYVYDLVENRNVYTNVNIAEYLGFSSGEVEEMGDQLFFLLMHPEEMDELPRHIERVLECEDGESDYFEYRMRHKDGQYRWFASHDTPFLRDAKGTVYQYLGTAFDITQRKEIEATLEKLYELSLTIAAAGSEERLFEAVRQLVADADATAGWLVSIDAARGEAPTTLTVDAAWHKEGPAQFAVGDRIKVEDDPFSSIWLKQPKDTVLITDILQDERLDEQTRNAALAMEIKAALLIPLYQNDEWVGVASFIWKQPHQFGALEQRIDRSLPSMMTPVARNIQLLEALNVKVRELNDSLIFKDQFLATMSHELRTPLNAVLGYSSIALTYTDLDAKIERMMSRIKVNSDRLMGLINDVLDISRINAGRIEIVTDPFDLKALATGWHTDFSKQATDKGLAFNFSYDERLPRHLIGDEERMSQIAGNLLHNAIKFTDEGEISLTVRAIDKKNEALEIIVTDTGIGISETWHHLIFEEFRQVEMGSERRYGGSGLGLSIVQKLCTLMNGQISMQSELGRGSQFAVRLPIVQAEQ